MEVKNNDCTTYLNRLRIPSFSFSSMFDRPYLSHSAVIFSSKPPTVKNVTTISGRSWMALQATPQSGLIPPVCYQSKSVGHRYLLVLRLEKKKKNIYIPHAGSVNKTRCPFRP